MKTLILTLFLMFIGVCTCAAKEVHEPLEHKVNTLKRHTPEVEIPFLSVDAPSSPVLASTLVRNPFIGDDSVPDMAPLLAPMALKKELPEAGDDEHLKVAWFQIKYANAEDLVTLLKDNNNRFLSAHGSVSFDGRTNTLLAQDTKEKLNDIQSVILKLDVPVPQVLIEARIVVAREDFEEALGLDFKGIMKVSGSVTLHSSNIKSVELPQVFDANSKTNTALNNLNVAKAPFMADGMGASQFGVALASIKNGTLLDLELSALEKEGLAQIISSPRLITSNQKPAYIQSGEELPYQEATSSGATSTVFKKAVLRLEVTPRVAFGGKVDLELTVNQDSKGERISEKEFAIDTRELHTHALVDDGETIVLGGIYQQSLGSQIKRIPLLWRIPVLGFLFQTEHEETKKSELLIFVTPTILNGQLTG